MLARILTLRFDSTLEGFDDHPLRDFLKDKDVLSLREHFFVKNDSPYLAVFVTYRLPQLAGPPAMPQEPRDRKETSWRELVTEEELPLFNTLRDWRAERSKKEGVPPYVICTNRQLAAMVKARPQSVAALGEIEGFGKAKLEKYGRAIVQIVTPQQVEDGPTQG